MTPLSSEKKSQLTRSKTVGTPTKRVDGSPRQNAHEGILQVKMTPVHSAGFVGRVLDLDCRSSTDILSADRLVHGFVIYLNRSA